MITTIDLNGAEGWREYDFAGRVYRIELPTKVHFRKGGSTHRVTDSKGLNHIVPAPGFFGCVVRFDGQVIA